MMIQEQKKKLKQKIYKEKKETLLDYSMIKILLLMVYNQEQIKTSNMKILIICSMIKKCSKQKKNKEMMMVLNFQK